MACAEDSLCDTCTNPGRCCSGFGLNIKSEHGATALHLLAALARAHDLDCNGRPIVGLPFLPLYETQPGHWRLWCPMLGRDGRCTDYEHRPAVCSRFVAGSDPLCAMHTPGAETREAAA